MGDENEIRRLDQRIDEETNETLDSSRRVLKVAVETNEIGLDTLTTLNEQGEKIHNVKQKFDEMKVDLGKADSNIREMEKVCGCCVCPPFGGRQRGGLHRSHCKKEDKGYMEIITDQPQQGRGSNGQGGFIKRVTGDKREDEIDENLGAVSKVLDNLGGIAVEMGSELDRQNKDLEELNDTAEDTEGHLVHSTHRLEHLL